MKEIENLRRYPQTTVLIWGNLVICVLMALSGYINLIKESWTSGILYLFSAIVFLLLAVQQKQMQTDKKILEEIDKLKSEVHHTSLEP